MSKRFFVRLPESHSESPQKSSSLQNRQVCLELIQLVLNLHASGLQETGCGERKKASYSTRSSQARNGSRAGTATHVLGSKDDKPRDNGCASHKVSFLRIRENQSNPTISRVRWFMAFASSSRKNVITFERETVLVGLSNKITQAAVASFFGWVLASSHGSTDLSGPCNRRDPRESN